MRKLRVFMDLAEAYREADELPQAIDAFEQASVELTALGRDDTETAGTLFNNWGLALEQMGRPLDAEQLLRRAIDISRADQSEQGVSPMLLNNYAAILEDLARFDEAAGYAERAYARAQKAGDEVVINQSLLLRSRLYRAQHHVPRAEATLDEVEPRLRKALPPGHYVFAQLIADHAMLELERGDMAKALRLADAAIDTLLTTIKAGKAGINIFALYYQRRGLIELQAGRPDRTVGYHQGPGSLPGRRPPRSLFLPDGACLPFSCEGSQSARQGGGGPRCRPRCSRTPPECCRARSPRYQECPAVGGPRSFRSVTAIGSPKCSCRLLPSPSVYQSRARSGVRREIESSAAGF